MMHVSEGASNRQGTVAEKKGDQPQPAPEGSLADAKKLQGMPVMVRERLRPPRD